MSIVDRKLVTLDDKAFRKNVLNALCDRKVIKKYVTRHGRVIAKKAAEDAGIEIRELETFIYTGKTSIVGIPIKTNPAKGPSYRRGGVKFTFDCEGENVLELNQDRETKDSMIRKYLNKYKVPLDKECLFESVVCVEKNEKTDNEEKLKCDNKECSGCNS